MNGTNYARFCGRRTTQAARTNKSPKTRFRYHLLWVLAIALCACDNTETNFPTQVMAVLEADRGVHAATQDVHILVRVGQNADAGWEVRHDQSLRIGEGNTGFPLSLVIQGDPTRVYELTATALDADGAVIARVRAISGYKDGELLALMLRFDDRCMNFHEPCADTETCSGGQCVSALVDIDSLSSYSLTAAGDDADADGG